MNKWMTFLIFLILLGTSAIGQEEKDKLHFASELTIGYPHLGSYIKERPILFMNQEILYQYSKKVAVGIGLGISAYPALLAMPISVNVHIKSYVTGRTLMITQSIGKNIKISPLFYSGYLYMGTFGLVYRQDKKVQLIPNIGYSFVADQYGGKSLSFLAGIRLSY